MDEELFGIDNVPLVPSTTPSNIDEEASSAASLPYSVASNAPVSEAEKQRTPAEGTDSSRQFKLDAFTILDSNEDYNSGLNQLLDIYNKSKFDDPDYARATLAEYSQALYQKTKQRALDPESIIALAPISPDKVSGEDEIDTINKWEEVNVAALENSKDPDQIAFSKVLGSQIRGLASNIRRDKLGGHSSWIGDKFFRFASGAVGPLAKLAGLDEADQYLIERTNPKSDESVTGMIASGLGMLLPAGIATAATGGPGGIAVVAAQSGGMAREAYKQSLEATGDPTRAAKAATLVGGAVLPAMLPVGSTLTSAGRALVSRLAGKAATSSAQSLSSTLLNRVVTPAAEGMAGGASAAVISNIGTNIGQDQDEPITRGAVQSALAFGIMNGGFGAIHAGVERAVVHQFENDLKKLKATQELTGKPMEPADPEKGAPKPKEENVDSYFVKDDKGFWQLKPDEGTTVDSRNEAAKNFQDYKEEYDSKIKNRSPSSTYDKEGNEVVISPQEDITVNADTLLSESSESSATEVSNKVSAFDAANELPDISLASPVLLGTSNIQPNRWSVWFAQQLGAQFKLRKNVSDGAFGSYDPKTSTVSLLRSMGSDPDRMSLTLSHELGHFAHHITELDVMRRALVSDMPKDVLMNSDMRELSEDWRGPWDYNDAKIEKYRGNHQELIADTISAFVCAPDYVRSRYPQLYAKLEETFSRHPVLNAFFRQIEEFNNNPDSEAEFNIMQERERNKKHGHLQAAIKYDQIKKAGLGATLSKSLDLAHQVVFNKLLPARRIVNKTVGRTREEAFKLFDLVARKDFLMHALSTFDEGVKQVWFKFKQTGIDPVIWPIYEKANKLLEEQTVATNKIRDNYDTAIAAAGIIKDILSKDKHVNQVNLNTIFDFTRINTPEDLSKAFANIGLLGDSAKMLTKEDFFVGVNPDDEAAMSQARWKYNSAVAHLNRLKQSLPLQGLLKEVDSVLKRDDIPEPIKDMLVTVTSKNAFSIRRFLVNENGTNVFDAKRDMAYIQKKLEEEQPGRFRQLQNISKEFHKALNLGADVIRESQMLTPEMQERFELNKDSYVTNLVLKHFEGDQNIDAGVRAAVGSFSETGNVLVATPMKMKAVIARAYYQRSVNSVIELAKLGGVETSVVGHARPDFDLFAHRDKLSNSDPDNSYLIGYEKGKANLYKIAGKEWDHMFKNVNTIPVLEPLLHLSDQLNKLLLTRQFKTIFSPAFVLAQKFYDRKLEAILANSFEFTGGLPIHVGGKLRSIDAESKRAIKKYKSTGEKTGVLKEATELEEASIQLATLDHQGVLTEGKTVYEDMHETFGEEQPDGRTTFDKMGMWAENKLEKFFFTKFFKEMAEFDELRTKLNGFQIGKRLWNMSDHEAAVFGRENFGVPDPMAGGYAAPFINRMFLFGRAHLNGLRVLGNLLKDKPKVAAAQITYRILLPKMLVMNSIMQPALRAAVGQEASDVFGKLTAMVPEIEKITNNIVIIGAQDGQGKFHNFFEIRPEDIQADWKAWYLRLPQSRELTSVTKVLWPLIKGMFEGRPGEAVAKGTAGLASNFTANIQPSVQYMINLMQMTMGKNPTDFFRQKDIFDRDTEQAGGVTGVARRALKYGQYVVSSQLPAYMPYNPWKTTDARGTGENIIQHAPVVGPFMRRLTGVSNYGLMEVAKDAQLRKRQIDSEIKLSTSDNTQQVLKLYSEAAGKISLIGKKWRKEVGPDVRRQMTSLTTWKAGVWENMRDRLRDAREKGDVEMYKHWLQLLDESATRKLEQLQSFRDAVDSIGESDK